MKKRILLFGIFAGIMLFSVPALAKTKYTAMNQAAIDKIRFEAKTVPTNNKNILVRWKALKTWIPILLEQTGSENVDAAMPREKFFTIDSFIENKKYKEAGILIDDTFKSLEKLVAGSGKVKPAGSVYGKVTDKNRNPVEGASVTLFGTDITARTDLNGNYYIDNVPVASRRYILAAKKPGFAESQAGNINVNYIQPKTVNFTLHEEDTKCSYLKEKLAVKIGYIMSVAPSNKIVMPAKDALIIPSLYPERIKPYLRSGKYIDINNFVINGLAKEILKKVPPKDKTRETAVAKAVYDWVVRNIEYDLMNNFPGDVTCGNWQTTYGAWGRSFSDWCYSPDEVIKEKRAISFEYENLATALLRALEIPARPALLKARPVTQWWVQLPDGSGYWANMDTSNGHALYKEKGDLGAKFPAVPDSEITFYSIDENAPIHMDWWTNNPCIWYEDCGEDIKYECTDENLKKANEAMGKFAKDGKIPAAGKESSLPGQESIKKPYYELYSRGFVIDLASIGNQKTLTAKFPVFPTNDYQEVLKMEYWTNKPDWFFRKYFKEEINPETGEKLSWYCIEFRW